MQSNIISENNTHLEGENTCSDIPFWQYSIDSCKILIDADLFKEVKIPQHFILMDAETEEFIDNYKSMMCPIIYNENKFKIGRITKKVGSNKIDKIVILLHSKVNKETYFNGITKKTVIDLLKFLKHKGYLVFHKEELIFDNMYCKDVDVKMDMKFKISEWNDIEEWFTYLKEILFNGEQKDIRVFTDNHRQQLGLGSTFDRSKGTIKKPFFKIYNKSTEIKRQENETLFELLPDNIKRELIENLILRLESTLKNKADFEHYNLSNKLSNLLDYKQEDWAKFTFSFMQTLFGEISENSKDKKIDISKLSESEKIMALMHKYLLDKGEKKKRIKTFYVRSEQTRKEKTRKQKLYEKIDFFIENDISSDTAIQSSYDRFINYNSLFNI